MTRGVGEIINTVVNERIYSVKACSLLSVQSERACFALLRRAIPSTSPDIFPTLPLSDESDYLEHARKTNKTQIQNPSKK